MLRYLLLAIPVVIIVLITRARRKKRAEDFFTESDSTEYTCPVCHMLNDSMKPCERCGFNPETKEGGIDYDDAERKKALEIIRRGM